MANQLSGPRPIDVQSEEVTCSFCSGKGTDPFGIMSRLSTCCVCKGTPQIARPQAPECFFSLHTSAGVAPKL